MRGRPLRAGISNPLMRAAALAGSLLLLCAGLSVPAGASATPVELPLARPADPAGRITALRATPSGVAVSPDAKTVLVIAGPALQGGAAPSAPGPLSPSPGVSLMVIDAATGVVRQDLKLDDAFQSVIFSPDGSRAYVAGGSSGNVFELSIDATGAVSQARTLVVGPFVTSLALTRDGRSLWVGEPEANRVQRLDLVGGAVSQSIPAPAPNALALSPDARVLYATDWRGTALSAIDTSTGVVRALPTGLHPTDVAVTPAGRVLVADANDASLATFEPGTDQPTFTDLSQLARRSDSPNAVRISSDGRVYVSLGADNAVAVLEPSAGPGSLVAPPAGVPLPQDKVLTPQGVVGSGPAAGGRPTPLPAQGRGRRTACRRTASHGPHRKLRCHNRRGRHRRAPGRARGHGQVKNRLVRRHHTKRLVRNRLVRRHQAKRPVISRARGGLAVGLRVASPRGWRVAGLIPTGWYPDALAVSPDAKSLYVVTARGLGHSATATAPYVDPDPASPAVDAAYGTVGTLETVALPPAAAGLAAFTKRAEATLNDPSPGATNANPILAGADGPIKHVIYITRENKTYDSILGDLHPGRPGNALVLFGRDVTPNIHALETQFAEADNFSYQAFASVVGHMWEDAGTVSDVFERAVASNTGVHVTHGNDSWHLPSNYPATGLLTEQAHAAGLSVRTYNEELAQQSGLLPAGLQAPTSVYPNYDLSVPDVQREKGWESEFSQFSSHRCTGALASTYGADCSLPSLEYVYLGEDHTTIVDQPGYPTIQAQVADNDYATARLIDAVSHSQYWKSTLVVVVEDDPQGTGDSRSAYHGLLGIASPYVKRGAISHTPYSLTSVIGAIDRVLGLPIITDFALTNRPLDDMFTAQPDLRPFTADPVGVQRYPFVALPGLKNPTADPRHGITSFTEPDHTIPAITGPAQWRAIKGTAPSP